MAPFDMIVSGKYLVPRAWVNVGIAPTGAGCLVQDVVISLIQRCLGLGTEIRVVSRQILFSSEHDWK
jgi:hypothetical protein